MKQRRRRRNRFIEIQSALCRDKRWYTVRVREYLDFEIMTGGTALVLIALACICIVLLLLSRL